MEDLLPDNFTAGDSSSSKEKGKQKKYPIPSVLAWAECFLSYMGVIAAREPARIPDLMAYMDIIIYAAWRFKGDEWGVYDSNFHRQAAALRLPKWADVNPSLWTMAFSNAVAKDQASAWIMTRKSAERPRRKELKRRGPRPQNASPSAKIGITANAAHPPAISGTSA